MDRYEGSAAVENARTAILIIGGLLLTAGFVLVMIGCFAYYRAEWPLVVSGIAAMASSIGFFILNAILKGFEQVVNASETYMEELRKQKAER